MKVLGIETSCDETGIAIYDSELGLITHEIYSQIPLHAQYGGVVPELASRDHVKKLSYLSSEVLNNSGLKLKDLDGIAYTKGPGLIGALMTGAAFSQGLAFALNCPSLGVHHMEGHLMAIMLEENKPDYPFVALLISGGHTLLVHVTAFGEYKILGESIDDAVGEAFDKTAKVMGLPYPGGSLLAKLALEGDHQRFIFPRPMTDRPGLDFSFSGLKTKVLMTIQSHTEHDYPDIAASFQEAIIETLQIKCQRALNLTQCKQIVIAGGVGANLRLRAHFKEFFSKHNVDIFYPRSEFCTDNGAMIAYVGHQRLYAGEHDTGINLLARWSLESLSLRA